MFVGHTTIGIEFNICRVSSRACISIVWQQLLRICCGLPLVLLLTLSVHLAGSLHQCAPSTHLYGLPIRFTMLKRAKKKWSRSRGSLESGNWSADFRDLKCVIQASSTPDLVCLSPRMSRLASLSQRIGARSFRKPWQRSSRGRYRTYLIQMSFPIRTLRCFWNMHFDVFEQGNRHIRANHAACCCLDSKPASSAEIESFCATQDVAGLANSSPKPNAVFVDVGYDTVLEAKVDLVRGTEVLPKYALA